jgi:hypothetical protein
MLKIDFWALTHIHSIVEKVINLLEHDAHDAHDANGRQKHHFSIF